MAHKISDLRQRDVINITDGKRLGLVSDVDVDPETGRIVALIVPGPGRFLGIFGGGNDYIIHWHKIIRIGPDVILVDLNHEEPHPPGPPGGMPPGFPPGGMPPGGMPPGFPPGGFGGPGGPGFGPGGPQAGPGGSPGSLMLPGPAAMGVGAAPPGGMPPGTMMMPGQPGAPEEMMAAGALAQSAGFPPGGPPGTGLVGGPLPGGMPPVIEEPEGRRRRR